VATPEYTNNGSGRVQFLTYGEIAEVSYGIVSISVIFYLISSFGKKHREEGTTRTFHSWSTAWKHVGHGIARAGKMF
jgi:hypothetical protein